MKYIWSQMRFLRGVMSDKITALAELQAQGAHVTTVEMALFALLRDAQHPAFKEISALIKAR